MFNTLKSKIYISIFIIICIMILATTYIFSFHKMTMTNAFSNLSEIALQNRDKLNIQIENNFSTLKSITSIIESENVFVPEEIFEKFKFTKEQYKFSKIGIINLNGDSIDSDGNNSKIQNFNEIKQELTTDVTLRIDKSNSKNAIIYTSPIKVNGITKEIIYAVMDLDVYKHILANPIFEKKSYSYILDSKGNVLIANDNGDTKEESNIFVNMDNNYIPTNKLLVKMKENMNNGQSGVAFFKYQNIRAFVSYQKLSVRDWYVVSTVPEGVIANQIRGFLTITIIITIIGIILFCSILAYIIVTSIKKKRQLYKIAYIDDVTNIGNRNLFFKKCNEYFAKLREKDRYNTYIIFLDIDKFKAINKRYGYEIGNKILYKIGRSIIKFFGENSIYARIANDNFGIVITLEDDNLNIDSILNKFNKNISHLKIEDIYIKVNLTIGVYKVNYLDETIEEMLDKAIMAHSSIKGDYLTIYKIYNDILETKLLKEQEIVSKMEDALQNGEFVVYYQPKIRLKDEKVVGAEALVRWKQKDGTIIYPNEFIPVFEKSRFIIKLDIYVFEEICKNIKKMKGENIPEVIVSVNVSKEHCTDENFIEKYMEISKKYEIDNSKIEIEITESAMFNNENTLMLIMKKIKEAGFRLSMDDFGTGYSSLSLLKRLPIDVLKIDKSFIEMADDESKIKHEIILKDIITLAKHIKVETVAEGIERETDAQFLKRIGCDVIQGYYYSKPLTLKQYEEYIINKK